MISHICEAIPDATKIEILKIQPKWQSELVSINTCKIAYDSTQEWQLENQCLISVKNFSASFYWINESPLKQVLLHNSAFSKLQRRLILIQTHFGLSCLNVSPTMFFSLAWNYEIFTENNTSIDTGKNNHTKTKKREIMNTYFQRASNVA